MCFLHTLIPHRHALALSISSSLPEPSLIPTLSATISSLKPRSLLPKLNPGEFLLQLQTPPPLCFGFFFITGFLFYFAWWVFPIHFSFGELNEKTTFFFAFLILLLVTCGRMT